MKLLMIAALALVAAADHPAPQPSYHPRPAYPAHPAPAHPGYKTIAILEEENVHPGDGTYSSSFSTENGIYRSEQGAPVAGYGKDAYGESQDGYRQEGSWSYSDGYDKVELTFVADENGYQPSGAVLPTPVPTEYPTPEVDETYVEPQPAYGKY